MNIKWTPIAKASYQDISDFILFKWSEKELSKFESIVDEAIKRASNSPFMAPVVFSNNIRRLVIHQNTSIFYTIRKQVLVVLLVWDNRKSPQKLIQALKNYLPNI